MITTTGLTRIYGKGENAVTAINNLDIRIDDGELVAITGKSGSGKTTLLNILGGLDKATYRSLPQKKTYFFRQSSPKRAKPIYRIP